MDKVIGEDESRGKSINYGNFFCTKKPVPLAEGRINKCHDRAIAGHIIVCGIVKGIRNLILPLRSKTIGSARMPIVILSNDSIGEENLSGDTYVWDEINRFEDVYVIKGSALNPADLERARISDSKAIIILAKSSEEEGSSIG